MNEWVFRIVKIEDGKETVLKRFTLIPKKRMNIDDEIEKTVISSGWNIDEVNVILEMINVECKPPQKFLPNQGGRTRSR